MAEMPPKAAVQTVCQTLKSLAIVVGLGGLMSPKKAKGHPVRPASAKRSKTSRRSMPDLSPKAPAAAVVRGGMTPDKVEAGSENVRRVK